MKSLAIFDFDGTLFDSIDDVVICFNMTLADYGFPTMTRDEYIPCLGGNIDEIVSLVLGDNANSQNVESVKDTYLNYYNSSKKENTIPFPKAHDTLRQLQDKGVLLAINSNRLTYSLNHFVEKYFSDIDFVAVEGHTYPNPSKPDPYGVERIIEKAGVDVSEVIYIGDSATDIKTAKNAGIDCILVSWGYGSKEDFENEYVLDVIEDESEILNYF
jgi:phosphoglycolate phosphatase